MGGSGCLFGRVSIWGHGERVGEQGKMGGSGVPRREHILGARWGTGSRG